MSDEKKALSAEDLRALIVHELRLDGLATEKQNEIIEQVSRALLERASIAVMSRLPIETVERISNLPGDEQAGALLNEAYASSNDNLKEVVRDSLHEGLQKYKHFVDEAKKTVVA